jgi:hypothetical protein
MVALDGLSGTKNVVVTAGESKRKEITDFLDLHNSFAVVRLTLPLTGYDESEIESQFSTIAFS